MKASKQVHGIFDNMWFYTKIWAKTFPIGLVIIPLFAAMSVLSIYEQINIPRVLVEVIERQGGVRDLFYALALPALLLIASKTANGVLKSGIMALGSRPMIYLYSVPINEKLFRIHYQMLTSPKVQSKWGRSGYSFLRLDSFKFAYCDYRCGNIYFFDCICGFHSACCHLIIGICKSALRLLCREIC